MTTLLPVRRSAAGVLCRPRRSRRLRRPLRRLLKTGPETILWQNGQIFVRCHDTDEVFRMRP